MSPTRIALAAAGLAVVIAGCIGGAARPSSSVAPSSASDGRSPTVQPSGPPVATDDGQPSDEAADRPPLAALMAEGGDPIEGQLGTYVWGSGGSDSPWLSGARIAVGAGEPLSVSVDRPPVSWSARSVPANAGGPAGATELGSGQGTPRFLAPDPGTWTVEVHLVFAGGDASYFWRLEVD